ncbi:probable 28S ribosomal protein S26, mitochondrial [Pectinophora gossypiella]|uniref:Small ribosomal subunit protein mS26 n=1 Tax=Pectinophora gossypiella TaxID=13191 RepID=A0A1E1WHP4_PECGO|nr:probable 28S ribosomal protein S26, mitochondrial [Pectinophora gossypiella]
MMSFKSLLKRTSPMVVQSAQAHRKPRWLPVARTKIYRIPKRPEVSEEERLELLRINNNYKTQMRAIRRFFHEEMIKEKSTLESTSSEMSQRIEAEEWERCVAVNARWNEQVAAEREQRRVQELAALEKYALKRMDAKDAEQSARAAKASAEIKLQKELSATFITPETLDEAIDHALANPLDFNFAIDLKGTQYPGRETPITAPKDEPKPATAQS